MTSRRWNGALHNDERGGSVNRHPTDRHRWRWLTYTIRTITHHRGRSSLIIASIAIAVAFFIFFSALAQGIGAHIAAETAGAKTGSITVTAPAHLRPMNETAAERVGAAHLQLLGTYGATGDWYPYIELPLMRRGEDVFGGEVVDLIGYNITRGLRRPALTLESQSELELARGNGFGSSGAKEVILGAEIWRLYYRSKRPGDRIAADIVGLPSWKVRIPSRNGPSEEMIVRTGLGRPVLAGILPSTGTERDKHMYTPLSFLQQYLGYAEDMNASANASAARYYPTLSLVVDDARGFDFDAYETALVDAVKDAAPMVRIDGYDNRLAVRSAALEARRLKVVLDDWLIVIVAVVAIIVTIGVGNTMLMAVAERRKEIGTLRAVGITRNAVHRLVLAESAAIGLFGYLIGTGVGITLAAVYDHLYRAAPASALARFLHVAPAMTTPRSIALAGLLIVGVGTLAALYPAARATRIEPIAALRYE